MKNYYMVCQCADGETFGIVEMTAEEAALVSRITNHKNWAFGCIESYSGYFGVKPEPLTPAEVEWAKANPAYLCDLFYGYMEFHGDIG